MFYQVGEHAESRLKFGLISWGGSQGWGEIEQIKWGWDGGG